MKKYEFTGKKLEATIEEALKTLNKNQEDVDIKIISEGGLFKKCKIEVIVEDEESQQAESFVEEIKEPETEPKENLETSEPVKTENETTITLLETDEKREVKEEAEEKTETSVKSLTLEEKLKKQEELNAERAKKYENKTNATYALTFVENLLKNMGVTDAQISQEDTLESSIIHVNSEKNAQIIGYKGDSLKNIQYLANLVEQRKNHESKRVVVHVGDYNTRHEEKIREMARKKAEKVLKFRKRIKLDPMNAFDRHLVHEELSTMENITTHSEGIEPNRRLVIEYIK